MNCTRQHLIDQLDLTDAPVLKGETLPCRLKRMCEWFFMRGQCHNSYADLVRQAMLELDETGMLKFND